MKNQFDKAKKFLKENIKKIFIIVSISFILIGILSIIYFLNNKELTEELVKIVSEKMLSEALDETGSISALGIFYNNLVACFLSTVTGLLPIIFIPVLILIPNAMIIGVTLAFVNEVMNPLLALLVGIMPHGIFELPAIFLSVSLGIYICKWITLSVFNKSKGTFFQMLIEVVRIFILIVVPLLVLAAVIETYITPIIMQLFLK